MLRKHKKKINHCIQTGDEVVVDVGLVVVVVDRLVVKVEVKVEVVEEV